MIFSRTPCIERPPWELWFFSPPPPRNEDLENGFTPLPVEGDKGEEYNNKCPPPSGLPEKNIPTKAWCDFNARDLKKVKFILCTIKTRFFRLCSSFQSFRRKMSTFYIGNRMAEKRKKACLIYLGNLLFGCAFFRQVHEENSRKRNITKIERDNCFPTIIVSFFPWFYGTFTIIPAKSAPKK